MQVIHGTWVPVEGSDFNNSGGFFLWVEKEAQVKVRLRRKLHPGHMSGKNELQEFLQTALGLPKPVLRTLHPEPATILATLPVAEGRPLPSHEMAQLTGEYPPEGESWGNWEIEGVIVTNALLFLRELRFITKFGIPDVHVGNDLRFWFAYAQQLRNVVRQHQFLPVMICHREGGRGERHAKVRTGLAPAAGSYERGLREFAAAMPAICRVMSFKAWRRRAKEAPVDCFDPVQLLRHFSEQQLDMLAANTKFTQGFLLQLKDNWLREAIAGCGWHADERIYELNPPSTEDWKKWNSWRNRVAGQSRKTGFILGIRLQQSDETDEGDWRLNFFVSSGRDPSLRIDLSEWWNLDGLGKAVFLEHFGDGFERSLLINLGHAARICPLLWQGMETDQPEGVDVNLATAYEFLKNHALVLESAGFKIVLPSWWTPEGRRRARVRVKVAGRSGTGQTQSPYSGLLGFDSLVDYDYELSVDGETVSEEEWQALVDAKSPLVRFRGEWMEIDHQRMSEMLELWRQQDRGEDGADFNQLLKDMAESDPDEVEFAFDDALGDTLNGLQNQEELRPMDDPDGLRGRLRNYQKVGLGWLARLEALGLNPCLADDMGLGKTIQLIALLLHEREGVDGQGDDCRQATLLVAPTSVLSNWVKEASKFAPGLNCMIHHGPDRARELDGFRKAIAGIDLVVTSFNLARSDIGMLKEVEWERVVVDEAQNIKNPKSAQTKAICSLSASRRIAMTGTPIENRLMDMWSLFHFLNPGYLGNAPQFRRAYEVPIQRNGDQSKSKMLQGLVQPFILRRLKTDKSIISDLPDKVEQKVYCSLTKEQASLYQAVVDDLEEQIRESEGIKRRGLMLSALMRLKQVCNHPAQFLQDGSAFDESRSHKLTRLNEMIEEALSESDSLLVFTQFTDIGDRLEHLLRERHACPVHYLHGGSSRRRRERMIESFQDPEVPAGIFVLSLRAGGVGITLTQANHVFHFDRWWNPAVEDQATDRAYRIGQEKTVFAHKMVTLGTLEERIDEMIESKQTLAESIVGNDENWLTEMDNDSFRELIALNRRAIVEA